MTVIEAAVLGTIQGLTEFLPISSSGHLAVAQHVFGIAIEESLFFDIILHIATLVAVILFFWKDILAITKKELLLLGIGTVPAVIFGVLGKDLIEQSFGSLSHIAAEFLITAGLLLLAHRIMQRPTDNVSLKKDVSPFHAMIIGIWQAIAIFPAISRSGATVTGAIMLGIERERAFRFSFLLSIPAIVGALCFSLIDIIQDPSLLHNQQLSWYIVGGFFSFVFGLLSLSWFQIIIKKTHLNYFGYYCIVMGILTYLISV